MATVMTSFIAPGTPRNKSENIQVGNYDNGPLIYSVNVIEDASPPMCTIQWDYQYKVPTHYIGIANTYIEADESLLPVCATADSREGYHMTYYWFSLFDWSLTSIDGELFTLTVTMC